jgi:hypothetical protein
MRQVLHRLQVQRDARRPAPASRLQPADDLGRGRRRAARGGFRLIRKRPLLSVALMPSTPMNEATLATAGSSQDRLGQRLLPLGHRGEGDDLRRLGDALDRAPVSCTGKKPLGMHDVEQHRQDQRADSATSSVAAW